MLDIYELKKCRFDSVKYIASRASASALFRSSVQLQRSPRLCPTGKCYLEAPSLSAQRWMAMLFEPLLLVSKSIALAE